jgi:hypothetical protein
MILALRLPDGVHGARVPRGAEREELGLMMQVIPLPVHRVLPPRPHRVCKDQRLDL